jgi:hypothetical protein
MAVPYVGAEAVVLRDVAAWLVASAAFRAFVGADDAIEAAACVIEVEGPDPGAIAHAVIDTPVLRATRTAGGDHDGTADVSLVFVAPVTPGDTDAEVHRRALNALSAIRRDLLDAGGQVILSVSADPPGILDPSDGLPAFVEFALAVTVEARP